MKPFDSGDSLLLYTDGVTDSGGPDAEPLPLAEFLEDMADAAPEYVLWAIEAEVTGAGAAGLRTAGSWRCYWCIGPDGR